MCPFLRRLFCLMRQPLYRISKKITIYPIISETNLNDDNCSLRLSK